MQQASAGATSLGMAPPNCSVLQKASDDHKAQPHRTAHSSAAQRCGAQPAASGLDSTRAAACPLHLLHKHEHQRSAAPAAARALLRVSALALAGQYHGWRPPALFPSEPLLPATLAPSRRLSLRFPEHTAAHRCWPPPPLGAGLPAPPSLRTRWWSPRPPRRSSWRRCCWCGGGASPSRVTGRSQVSASAAIGGGFSWLAGCRRLAG